MNLNPQNRHFVILAAKMWTVLLLACVGVALAADGPCHQKNAANARRQQEAAANGNIIADLPIYRCDEDGTFARVQCMGGHNYCYCASKDGTTIRNYHHYTEGPSSMNCNCARDQSEYHLIGKMFSCEENGNYKPIQCTGSACYCADEFGKDAGNGNVHISEIRNLEC